MEGEQLSPVSAGGCSVCWAIVVIGRVMLWSTQLIGMSADTDRRFDNYILDEHRSSNFNQISQTVVDYEKKIEFNISTLNNSLTVEPLKVKTNP